MKKHHLLLAYVVALVFIGINVAISIIDISNAEKLDETAVATVTNLSEWKDSDGDWHYSCDLTYIAGGEEQKVQDSTYKVCHSSSVGIRYEKDNHSHYLVAGSDASSAFAYITAFITIAAFSIIILVIANNAQHSSERSDKELEQKMRTEILINQICYHITIIYILVLSFYYYFANDYLTTALTIFLWGCLGLFLIGSIAAFVRGNVLRSTSKNSTLMSELKAAEQVIRCDMNDIYFLEDSIVVMAYSVKRIYYHDIVDVKENHKIETYLMRFEIKLSNGKNRNLVIETEDQIKDVRKHLLAHKVLIEESK